MNKLFISTTTFAEEYKDSLKNLSEAKVVYELNPQKRKLLPEETAYFAAKSTAIIAGVEDLTPLVESSKSLKFICRLGVGLENVPFDLCQKKGIKVSFTPDSVTPAISELTVSLMLSTVRNICLSDRLIRLGKWKRKMGMRLGGSTVGLIGFGRVGQQVAELLISFKPKLVLVYDTQLNQEQFDKIQQKGLNLKIVSLNELLGASDIVSLHVGLNKSTRNMISKRELVLMNRGSILINTSRGGVVNEQDLFIALNKNLIAGAALDVFEEEPYAGSLINLENVILSPHQGSATRDCRVKMEIEAVKETINFFQGLPLQQEVTL
jgi:D-3-phosphoglycerate dehydrogenase / 2-oxoglutarate reductase